MKGIVAAAVALYTTFAWRALAVVWDMTHVGGLRACVLEVAAVSDEVTIAARQ